MRFWCISSTWRNIIDDPCLAYMHLLRCSEEPKVLLLNPPTHELADAMLREREVFFKYAPPIDNTTIPHSIYLLPKFRSFLTCNLTGVQMLADVTQGGRHGFAFVLKEWEPHYFACIQYDGIHCSLGQMKFFVMPMLCWFR